MSSGRILSAKRATHTGRGSANSRGIWDRVEAAAGSQPRATVGANGRRVPGAGGGGESFPTLGAPGPSKPSTHSTPWASGGAGSSSKAPSALAPQIRSVNYSTGPSRPKQVNKDSFPSLPTSQAARNTAAERAALFSKPTARQESIARIRGTQAKPPPTSGWGGSAASSTAGSSSGANANGAAQGIEDLALEDPQPKSKKKGKQKQLLFSVSASGK